MILGENKRECLGCRKMKPYEDFDYEQALDDIWGKTASWHMVSNCDKCYQLKIDKQREDRKRWDKEILINKRILLIYDPVPLHLAACDIKCPKCDKRSCGCLDPDLDGFTGFTPRIHKEVV